MSSKLTRREAKLIAADVVRAVQGLSTEELFERFPAVESEGIDTQFEDALDPRSGKAYAATVTLSRDPTSGSLGVMAMVTAQWPASAETARTGARRLLALGRWVVPVIRNGLIGEPPGSAP